MKFKVSAKEPKSGTRFAHMLQAALLGIFPSRKARRGSCALRTATEEQRSGRGKSPQPEGIRPISPDHFVNRTWGIDIPLRPRSSRRMKLARIVAEDMCETGSRAKEPMGGFTLIELSITVGIIIALAISVIVIIDPIKQFAKGRNTQRKANLEVILGAIGQNIADNKGSFSCAPAIPTSTTRMASSSPNYNISSCLVTTYLNSLPFDPSTSGAKWASATNYDTGYTIAQNASTGRITLSAPAAELGESITYTR